MKMDIAMTLQRIRKEDLSCRELDRPERFIRARMISEPSQKMEIAEM